MSEVIKYKEIPIGNYVLAGNCMLEDSELEQSVIAQIDDARDLLFDKGLIGKLPDQPAHGNICVRLPELLNECLKLRYWNKLFPRFLGEPYYYNSEFRDALIVTASQTGGKKVLTPTDYVVILHYDPTRNLALKVGQASGSSEVPTLASVLKQAVDITDSDPPYEDKEHIFNINCVAHGHDASIWRNYKKLGLPATSDKVAYGTPEMHTEVERLFKETSVRETKAFVMLGHKGGIVSFAEDPKTAAQLLIDLKQLAEKN